MERESPKPEYGQARWPEPPILELGRRGRVGFSVPRRRLPDGSPLEVKVEEKVPRRLLRREPLSLPSLSEPEVVRHFTRLSQMAVGVDVTAYPLGSCTMKYNPKVSELLAALEEAADLNPHQDEATIQGALQLMYELSQFLAELTGMDAVSLQPAAGAQAEYVGALIMRAYHKELGALEEKREVIIPDSAHGTNFTSFAMAGFRVIMVPAGEDGCVDLEALASVVSRRTAGLILTNPNTLGIFEKDILRMAEMVHDVGGLLYYDGANLNAILGKARPGDMGFDIAHLNLHKTFATPHGGGGPGSGPVGVKGELEKFLPVPVVEKEGSTGLFRLNYGRPHSIGMVNGFYGNFGVLLRAYVYIRMMGAEGLVKASEGAVLNANYLASRICRIRGFTLPFSANRLRKHECVFSCSQLKRETGVTAMDVAKRLLDLGFHAPTIYFPRVVEEALMVEFPETEPLEELERFVAALQRISDEAYGSPDAVRKAPTHTSISRLDEVRASHPRTLALSERMKRSRLG